MNVTISLSTFCKYKNNYTPTVYRYPEQTPQGTKRSYSLWLFNLHFKTSKRKTSTNLVNYEIQSCILILAQLSELDRIPAIHNYIYEHFVFVQEWLYTHRNPEQTPRHKTVISIIIYIQSSFNQWTAGRDHNYDLYEHFANTRIIHTYGNSEQTTRHKTVIHVLYIHNYGYTICTK